jgi:hypothetical protein
LARILALPTMRLALSVLESERPILRMGLPFGSAPTDHVYVNGLSLGYEKAMALLVDLSKPQEVQAAEPEATFATINNDPAA